MLRVAVVTNIQTSAATFSARCYVSEKVMPPSMSIGNTEVRDGVVPERFIFGVNVIAKPPYSNGLRGGVDYVRINRPPRFK